jgi:hypothetical protein
MKKLNLLIALLLFATSAFCQTGLTARSMGMAGAYQSRALGPDATRWNPANLALPEEPTISLILPVFIPSFAMSIGNNSLNLDLYNNYFSQEYFDQHPDGWDDAAIDQILSNFDNDFRSFNQMHFTVLGASYKQFAFAVNGFIYSKLRLPKTLFEIPFQGFGTDPIPFSNVEGEVIAASEFALSVAKTLHPDWDMVDHFSVGATFKYFYGFAYAKVEDAQGVVMSSDDSITVNGNYRLLKAIPMNDIGSPGDGVGLDLGASAKIGKKLTLGLAFNNLVGSINFGDVEETQGSISVNEPGINIDELDNFGDYIEDVSNSTDTTFTCPEVVRYYLPKVITLSANYRLTKRLILEADYQQGLNNTAGNSTTPRLAFGGEFRYVPLLPLRFGFSMGGMEGTMLAAGFGLDFKIYQIDFAAAGNQGLFNSSKGVFVAMSQRINF